MQATFVTMPWLSIILFAFGIVLLLAGASFDGDFARRQQPLLSLTKMALFTTAFVCTPSLVMATIGILRNSSIESTLSGVVVAANVTVAIGALSSIFRRPRR